MDGEWRSSGCNFCAVGCGIDCKVRDNHIVDVRPSEGNVRTPHTYVCRKGRSSMYFQENPDRLNYPLKRVGDKFVRISWEQAYAEISARLKEILDTYGPRSVAFTGLYLANDQSEGAVAQSLMNAMGTQYLCNPTGIEFMGNWWSEGRILGHEGYPLEPDEKNVDVLVFWGSNAYVTHQIGETRPVIREMSERPDKTVVVVDPRLSETARMADIHVHPRNGVDALLVRGMIALILDKGWQDQQYLEEWCADWDKAKYWFDGFDYRKAFEVCQVPYEQIEDLCRLLTTKTWGMHQDLGVFCGRHNTLNSYMLICLMAVTGNLLIKGNVVADMYLPVSNPGDERAPGVWRMPVTDCFPVAGTYPASALSQEILSPRKDRIRCVISDKGNPAASFGDTAEVEKAFKHLDLLVAIDVVMSDTCKLADYVLPGKTGFEEYQFSVFQYQYPDVVCFMKHPIISQIEERRDSCGILLEIARRLGYVPEMPAAIYEAAAKSVKDRDIVPFILRFLPYMKKHPEYEKYMPLMMVDALARPEALGSAARASLRAVMDTSVLAGTGIPERAGYQANGPYRLLKYGKKTKALYDLSVMDNVFWAVDDNDKGAVIGRSNPDPVAFTKEHIHFPDHKIHMFDELVNEHIRKLTPESEAAALDDNNGFPMVVSSGDHKDSGVNTYMKNPDTYRFRDPYELLINPEDAERLGISDREEVRVVTKGGSIRVPVCITYRTRAGYCIVPEHFGVARRNGKVYGEKANKLLSWDEKDEISGNPLIRYIPCRIEKL